MSVHYTFEDMTDHLLVAVFGHYSGIQNVMEFSLKLVELAESLGRDKVLLDHSQTPYSLDVAQNHHFTTHSIQNAPRGRHIRWAIVSSPASRDAFEYYVLAASNRGVTVQVFESPEQARAWLRSEKRPSP